MANVLQNNSDETASVTTNCSGGSTEGSRSSDEFPLMEDIGPAEDEEKSDQSSLEIEEKGAIWNPESVENIDDSVQLTSTREQNNFLAIGKHLTDDERVLLESCISDATYQRKDGKVNWDEVAVKFVEMADQVNVFCRSKKRLRSSSKNSKEKSKKRMSLSKPSDPCPIVVSE